MYKAGLCTIAGSVDGLKNAFTADKKFEPGVAGINVSDLEPKDYRIMQIGANSMRRRIGKAVEDAVKRVAPDKRRI